MKCLILVLLAAAAFALPAYTQQPLTPEQKKGAEEVLATIAKWADAVRDRNMKALDQIFAEDLYVTLPNGQVRRRADELKALEPNASVRTVSIANDDVEVRMLGEAAVVTATVKFRYKRDDNIDLATAMRYTAVFVKRDGRWQLVVLQTANAPSLAPAVREQD